VCVNVGCVVGCVVGRVVGHVVVVVDVGDVARREQSSCSEKTQKTRVRLQFEFIWFTFETFRADTMGLEGKERDMNIIQLKRRLWLAEEPCV
jgi:hypothetical protein